MKWSACTVFGNLDIPPKDPGLSGKSTWGNAASGTGQWERGLAAAPLSVPICFPHSPYLPGPVGMGVPLPDVQVGLCLRWDLPVYGLREGSEQQSPHLQNKFLP